MSERFPVPTRFPLGSNARVSNAVRTYQCPTHPCFTVTTDSPPTLAPPRCQSCGAEMVDIGDALVDPRTTEHYRKWEAAVILRDVEAT